MFGTNRVAKAMDFQPDLYALQDVFYTLQGEGPFAGMPAVFVRLRGCNLRCHFCDTDFESGVEDLSRDELIERIVDVNQKASLVVITGGEPMLQNLGPLCVQLVRDCGLKVQIETAGTVWPDSFNDEALLALIDGGGIVLVCSPKTSKVHDMVGALCHHWKYIVSTNDTLSEVDGLPLSSTQHVGGITGVYRPAIFTDPSFSNPDTIWVQPCEEYDITRSYKVDELTNRGRSTLDSFKRDDAASAASMKRAAEIAMQYGYRLTVQMHKLAGIP